MVKSDTLQLVTPTPNPNTETPALLQNYDTTRPDTVSKAMPATVEPPPIQKAAEPIAIETIPAPEKKPELKPKEETIERIVLTSAKKQEILDAVLLEKSKMNSFSNCIQLRKTATCNVTDAFSLANYLRSKGFIISGRLTVDKSLQGIAIDASDNCIVLTIGIL